MARKLEVFRFAIVSKRASSSWFEFVHTVVSVTTKAQAGEIPYQPFGESSLDFIALKLCVVCFDVMIQHLRIFIDTSYRNEASTFNKSL